MLDPKKSQNIAILLRALNVTRDEESDALLDGKLVYSFFSIYSQQQSDFRLRSCMIEEKAKIFSWLIELSGS